MKKIFRLTAIAVIALGLSTACNNNKTAEVEDTLSEDTLMIVEDTIDSIVEEVAEEPVVEEPVKPAKKATATTKKEEKKDVVPSATPKKIGEGNNTSNTPTTKSGAKKVEQTVKTTDITTAGSPNTPSTKLGKKN